MATASTSGLSSFGLSRRKKAPGLMDQISTFFGGDKHKRGKGSFRGHATSPKPAPRRRANENAVMHFFRSLTVTASPRPKSRETKSRLPPNAGAPSSELSLDEKTMEKDEEEKVLRLTDSQQPLTTLTH